MSSTYDKPVATDSHADHGAEGHVHVMPYDPIGDKLGMWTFLFGEFLLFFGMFILYGVYLNKYPHAFQWGSGHLQWKMGMTNTIFLVTSSLTMVLGVNAMQRNQRGKSQMWLTITLCFAFAFFVVKYFEWSAKIEHGIYPDGIFGSAHSHLPEMANTPVGELGFTDEHVTRLKADGIETVGKGISIYFGLYYIMTGLHGLHVFLGIILISVTMVFSAKGKITHKRYSWLENVGLYWHLVDLIWIFLFPLFYLIS